MLRLKSFAFSLILILMMAVGSFASTITVSAGNNQILTVPTTTATLNGSVSAGGASINARWSVITSPANATVTFANPTAITTTATFSVIPGVYVLNLSAATSGAVGTDSVVITINGATTAPQVNIAWDASSDPSVSGYNVYRSLSSSQFTGTPINGTTLVTVPTYTDNAVTSGTIYYYTVRAVNNSGVESQNSNVIGVTAK